MARGGWSPVRKLVTGTVLLLLSMLAPFAYVGWQRLYRFHFETGAPVISFREPPPGIGIDPISLEIEVADEGSGLDLVIVSREQDGDMRELVRKRYDRDRRHRDIITVALNGKAEGLFEGPARIQVTAFDKSFLSNRAKLEIELEVDYAPPKVEVLTTQHNAVVGGCSLVFYRVTDRDETVSFVKVGSWLFQGYRAAALDPDFQQTPEIYFAFFALPLEFQEGRDKLVVFVRDQVGNAVTVPFTYRVGNFPRAKREIRIPEELMRGPVEQLYARFVDRQGAVDPRFRMPVSPPQSPDDAIARFRVVNSDYRKFINGQLERIFLSPKPRRFWHGRFAWLPGKTQTFFGEEQRFTYEGRDAGVSIADGVDLASYPNAPIPAANDGIVVFADELDVYGKTLIIDHGFGLTSLYAHLSNFATGQGGQPIREGDRVMKGETIGFTGTSGLSFGNRLRFEIRMAGIPVRPTEWWDKRWIDDHIERKIAEMKKLLGVETITPID